MTGAQAGLTWLKARLAALRLQESELVAMVAQAHGQQITCIDDLSEVDVENWLAIIDIYERRLALPCVNQEAFP